MALDQIPPWISVGPTDYLHAVQAGGAAGLGIAEAQNRAREAAARTAEAQRAAAQQQWEFGEKMRQAAEEHASHDELEKAHLAQQAAALAQTGEYQKGMLGYHTQSLNDAMQRAAMANESRGNLLDLRAQHYNDLMDWRQQLMDQRDRLAEKKLNPTDYYTEEIDPSTGSEAVPAKTDRWFGLPDVPAVPAVPAHGKITRRVPIGRLGAALGEAPPEPLPSDYQLGTPEPAAPNMGSLLNAQPGVDQSWMTPTPIPKSKSELVTGKVYMTSRGLATWDGEKFVK